jgi:site-specific DNA-methyltransferase (cytosine-N4-specific)
MIGSACSTELGAAWCGEAIDIRADDVETESVDLMVTLPPFALQRPNEYGNEDQANYVASFSVRV